MVGGDGAENVGFSDHYKISGQTHQNLLLYCAFL
jgi:hypothetical protein